VFDERGIEVSDFFASDGFVRGQQFHGKTVLSYSQVCEKYSDFIVVVSFGTRLPEVLENIYRLDSERELYIPDVPVAGGDVFDIVYFNLHKRELVEVCDMLADERSRETFCDVIMYKLTGKLDYLRFHVTSPDEVYRGILSAGDYINTADLGAYNGDSIRELAEYAPKLGRVAAFEPDARTFKKLTAFAETAPYKVDAYNYAAWDSECELEFTSGGNRNSTLVTLDGIKTGAKRKSVSAARLDFVYGDSGCDYIKYDVEGAEYEALVGSRVVIEREYPELLVSLYHRSEDLFRLPLLVRELGYERLYIRRYEYVPAWDLNLLAIK
ncbi:MAG: FkbM family methyltransferase, partial [Clostridiales bacterium]|nr:FkbM family methyltransferase [Clostridiales bacterium]